MPRSYQCDSDPPLFCALFFCAEKISLADVACLRRRQVRALYKHEGKNQQGFILIGFEKGDVMILVKKRDDGWSRVRKGDAEGWAPTSYLEDYVEPAHADPVAPQRSLSSQSDAGGDDGDGKGPAKDPAECVAEFGILLDAAVDVAKKIQLRDRELAKLSNQVSTQLEIFLLAYFLCSLFLQMFYRLLLFFLLLSYSFVLYLFCFFCLLCF